MADTTDLLGYAFDKNPVDFASTFDQLMRQKAETAIEDHRITLAQSVYGADEESDGDDESFDFDDDDDIDGLDDDDLDLDLDDLDLDDLDLDDNEDSTDDQEDA